VLLSPTLNAAHTADSVLVVVNGQSPDSNRVADAYVRSRSVPADHVVRLRAPLAEQVTRAEYEQLIEAPLASFLLRNALQDQILFIVLTKDIPLRVAGTGGQDGTVASVDSELTLLYRRMLETPVPVAGRVPNPYFLGDAPVSTAKPISRISSDLYLVTRLDGFTVEDALGLVERSKAPSTNGVVVLDQRGTLLDRGGNAWLKSAADALQVAGAGDRVVLETTAALATSTAAAIGYYSFGSNDPAYRVRNPGLQFSPGAIGGMFVSTDGRTFVEPPADWRPGESQRPPGQFGNGSQSVAGDLIRAGMTGVSAHVAEPYLDATVRPQVLFPAYVSGFTLAEAFYLATPFLSWQTMILGDPLCAPFAKDAPDQPQTAGGPDPTTDMPFVFSERRIAVATKAGLRADAVRLMLKGTVQALRGNAAEAEKLHRQAADLEPRLVSSQLLLAEMARRRNEFDDAVTRYRQVVATEPNNAAASNNLAYLLAVERNQPGDALPLALRAFKLLPSNATADTVGWIYHLLHNDESARPYMEIVLSAPATTDMYVHAATVFVELKAWTKAKTALDAAEKQDPPAKDRADVKALRAVIK